MTVNAPSAGTITETFAEEEDTVTVGKDLFKIEAGDKPAESASKSEEKPKEDEGAKKEEEPKKEESSAKKEEPKQEESQPESKRKKSESSEKYEKREQEPKRDEPKVSQAKQPTPEEKSKAKESSSAAGESSPDTGKTTGSGERTERRVRLLPSLRSDCQLTCAQIKLNRMRQRIAERLKQSQNTAASLTTFNEIDMTQLMDMRKLYKDKVLKDHDVKLGFMSAFGRAACIALQEIPAANASIEGPGAGEQIVYRDYVDLSVAVSTPKGLVTPVVRNADKMSFIEIERSIAELGKKARDNKLTLEDMTGGSFTMCVGCLV